MLVNAISLKPFPQSTSNLKFVFTLSIGQTQRTLYVGTTLKFSLEQRHDPLSSEL